MSTKTQAPVSPTRDQVLEALLKDPEYRAMQRRRGQADGRNGKRPTEVAGPYWDGYCSEDGPRKLREQQENEDSIPWNVAGMVPFDFPGDPSRRWRR